MTLTLWSRMQWPSEILDCNFTEDLTVQTHFLLVNSHSPLPVGELSLTTSYWWTLIHHFLGELSLTTSCWWTLAHHFLLVNSCSPLSVGELSLTTFRQWTLTHHFLLVNSHPSLPVGELSLTKGTRLTAGEQERKMLGQNLQTCGHYHIFVRPYISGQSLLGWVVLLNVLRCRLTYILGTSWDQCRSMVQYGFMSTETRRLVRMDSPGRPPRLSHSSWTMTAFSFLATC